VHVNFNTPAGARAAAFDVNDGHVLWVSDPVDFGYHGNQLASAVVSNGVQVVFTTGPDFDPKARPGYGIFDAATGATLAMRTVIPEADLDAGYAGGGVWGTPSADPATKYLFAGTANPDSPDRESQYDNAIIKIDLDRSRPTFGQVVASFKGQPDSVTGYDNAVCSATGQTIPNHFGGQQTCGQTDIDFGNGPTLWRNAAGQLRLAILQKSAVLHVLDADTMTPVWEKTVGLDSFVTATGGNISRIATDGTNLYVTGDPGILQSYDSESGALKWAAAHNPYELTTGGNVVYANGVVYHTVAAGATAFDAATGKQLWTAYTPQQAVVVNTTGQAANGTAVAGNRVIVNAIGVITAYALPDVAPAPAAQGEVVAGPAATLAGFATRTAVVSHGSTAEFVNLDSVPHNVRSEQADPVTNRPVFASTDVATGERTPIDGVSSLSPGTYGFYCAAHPGMTGSLVVR
jgi:plastocyanin